VPSLVTQLAFTRASHLVELWRVELAV